MPVAAKSRARGSVIPRKKRFHKKNVKRNFDWFDLYFVLTRQFITSNDDQLNGPKVSLMLRNLL